MRRRYSKNGGRNNLDSSHYAREHVRQYFELSNRLGPIVDDLKKAFFDLPDTSFDSLLLSYREIYGNKAADYVTRAKPAWVSGKTKMSGQTMERLINLIPKYLTYNQRYQMVEDLCEHHKIRHYETVKINIDDPSKGFQELSSALERFCGNHRFIELPDHVEKTLTWLSDDDIIVARALLAEYQQKQAKIVYEVSTRNKLFIQRLIFNKEITDFHEVIEFPNGDLTVYSFKDSFCIIATLVYGSYDHTSVQKLRKFRDNHLTKTLIGRNLTIFYYKRGPIIAELVKNIPPLKYLIRCMLSVFICLIRI